MAETSLKKRPLFQFLYPGIGSLLAIALISFVLLIMGNVEVLFDMVTGNAGSPVPEAGISNPYSTYVGAALELPIIGRVTLLLFWAAVGAFLYVLFWFGQNVVYIVEKEVQESEYITGRLERHRGYWGSAMSDNIFLGASLILGLFYLLIAIQVVYPYALAISASAIQYFSLSSIGYIIFALFTMSATIYIGSLVLKTLRYSWKQFTNR